MKFLLTISMLLVLASCASDAEEPVEQIEFFQIVGNVDGGNDGPDERYSSCDVAPVDGSALAIVKVNSLERVVADPPQEVCDPNWEFNTGVYQKYGVEVSAWLGGDTLPNRFTLYSKRDLGDVGGYRLVALTRVRDRFLEVGYRFEVEPSGSFVSMNNQAILFPGRVETFRAEVADVRAAKPETCEASRRSKNWDAEFARDISEREYFDRFQLEKACADWQEPTNDPDPVP